MNPTSLRAHIDLPASGQVYDRHNLPVAGWLLMADEQHEAIESIHVYCQNVRLGECRLFFCRPDVDEYLKLPPGKYRTGFELRCVVPPEMAERNDLELELRVTLRGLSQEIAIGTQIARLHPAEAATRMPYFQLLDPKVTRVFHRENIYGSGPSLPNPSLECLRWLVRGLGEQPCSVIDIGCGFGAYGPPLIERGHRWLGVEIKASDCEELARRGLPHQQVDGGPLPFGDGEFDAAICVEVLEHIVDTDAFLSEIARVIKRRAIFSVPNCELIPLMSEKICVPWHLLEADHKNFFTHFSLRELLSRHFPSVEVLDYSPHPLEGVCKRPLPYHLLAIADRA